MSNKYFYKISLLINSAEVNPFIEEQIEEYNGLTDLEGQPFRQKKVNGPSTTNDISQLKDNAALFPVNTLDGDVVTEQNYTKWLKREIRDYIEALVETYEWKQGVSKDNRDHVLNYVLGKGWSQFVNRLNPIKQFISNGNDNYRDYVKKHQELSGRTLKREYRNIAKRIINKKVKNDISMEPF